jgi:membrane-bound serine protease (ClpP class)
MTLFRKNQLSLTILLIILTIGSWTGIATAQDDYTQVLTLTYDGALTPAMHEYIARGLRVAEQRGADLVIFQINTPGGSVTIMNQIVQTIRGSDIPVVVYVYPRGAMAASAGVLITLAGHASAMAPETIIGAASPIDMTGEDLNETAAAKEMNALIATVETLTTHRPPEAVALAKDMILTARAVSVDEALEVGLVDYTARNLDNLLTQLDGSSLEVNGRQVTLNLADAEVVELPLSLIEQLLSLLTNPNIVFILLTLGVQALLIELYTPGGWVAGFIGVVCLALAIYGLGVLPVNLFGLIFLVTAFVLFILEIKTPTMGALTAAGVGSLIVGALVLFNSPGTPDFQRISIPVVIIVAVVTAGVFFTIVTFAVRSLRAPVRTGQESLAHTTGTARSDILPGGTGTVQASGELWTAVLADDSPEVKKGERVIVEKAQGVRLFVRKDGSGG